MPRFELDTLTSYDDQSLINELRRVAALIPDSKFGSIKYDKLGKVHSSTLRARFGTWRQVLSVAGLEDRFDESQEPWSREKIIKRLQSIAQRTGRNSVTTEELSEDDGPTARPVHRLFGSYRAALEAAGLSQNKVGVRYTDEECYENLLTVWTALGRQPNYTELKNPPSKVGPKAYILRWGSWRKALQAFIDRVNQDTPAEVQKAEIRDVPSGNEIKIKRTSRAIPLGLRYTVLVRDRFRCVICGRSPATNLNVNLHVDHITAWASGGETVLENLRSLCSDCNLGKGCREEGACKLATVIDRRYINMNPDATDVFCTDDALQVTLSDGRIISVPLAWSPRLSSATPAQRKNWRLIAGGVGIHWEEIDEDISVRSLLRLS